MTGARPNLDAARRYAAQVDASVIRVPFVRIVRAPEGGWYVIVGQHGWLCGSRRDALGEKNWLDQQWRRT